MIRSTSRLLVASLWVFSAHAVARTSPLIECADIDLATMDAAAIEEAFVSLGAAQCTRRRLDWAESIACDQAHGITVFGLSLRELRAEITDNGTRRIGAVSTANEQRVRTRVKPPVSGLIQEIEAREDGATTISCIAAGTGSGTNARRGALQGRLPGLPDAAFAWRVCAQAVDSNDEQCVDSRSGGYRIGSLQPGDYRLHAQALGTADPALRAELVRKRTRAASADRGGEFLLDQVSVRAGATSEVPRLQLIGPGD